MNPLGCKGCRSVVHSSRIKCHFSRGLVSRGTTRCGDKLVSLSLWYFIAQEDSKTFVAKPSFSIYQHLRAEGLRLLSDRQFFFLISSYKQLQFTAALEVLWNGERDKGWPFWWDGRRDSDAEGKKSWQVISFSVPGDSAANLQSNCWV